MISEKFWIYIQITGKCICQSNITISPRQNSPPVPNPYPQVKRNYSHSPRHHFSENLSSSHKDGGGGNYAEKAVTKPFLSTVITIVFGANILSESSIWQQFQNKIVYILCSEMEKSIFSCSLNLLKYKFLESADFLVFQKKIIGKSSSVLILCSFKYCFSEGN